MYGSSKSSTSKPLPGITPFQPQPLCSRARDLHLEHVAGLSTFDGDRARQRVDQVGLQVPEQRALAGRVDLAGGLERLEDHDVAGRHGHARRVTSVPEGMRSGRVEVEGRHQPLGRAVRPLRPLDRRRELGLDELDRELDGVRHELLVDQLQRLLRQVVLLVREVEDAQRRDAGLGKREVVGPGLLAELRDDVVALRQAEPLDDGLRAVEQGLGERRAAGASRRSRCSPG